MKKGSKHSIEAKAKIQKSLKGKRPVWIDVTPGPTHAGYKHGQSRSKEYKAHYRKKRRASEKGAGGSHSFMQWETLKAQYNWTCPSCKKKEPKIKLTVDHIIPLSRGGSHNIENIQPLCLPCNNRKQANTIRYEI